MRRVGLIVNPVAGMGGAVGLKGTDGPRLLERAIALGAAPVALERGKTFLRSFGPLAGTIEFVTCPGAMGEDAFRDLGIPCEVMPAGPRSGRTTAEDTRAAARAMSGDVSILAFCGGDGTARDVLDAVGQRVPVVGVPSGVKMHSGVFATSPSAAACVTIKFLWDELPLREAEVADVDEEAFRAGRVSSRLYGYLLVPYEPTLVQGMKSSAPLTSEALEEREAIARWIVEGMRDGVLYVLGPGSTVKGVSDELGIERALLGVDLVLDRRLLKKDANERDILEEAGKRKGSVRIVISPIGRQGFVFGRGNQQISGRVLREVGRDSVLIVATEDKLKEIDALRVDTGDAGADAMFKGWAAKVLVDYNRFRVVRFDH